MIDIRLGRKHHATTTAEARQVLAPGPTPGALTERDVRALAAMIAEHGFSVERSAQAALWAGARRHGVSPVVIAVAADPTETSVARYRALAMVVARYCALLHTPEIDLLAPAAAPAVPAPTSVVA